MKGKSMEIRTSAQDYLETILLLSRKKGEVRSIDIVGETGYSRPSVSVAVRKLRESGLIRVDADGFITLTDEGQGAAEQVYERHSTIYDWLVANGVSGNTAAGDACRMEHVISDETFDLIKKLKKRDE
ncbi:MAG: metal-dependent transcriptional regulator [Clostridiales Family XIII bacterium]|jgi:Mn-dependent DtxR family transcriptional regulator|nr:metal-dependent transcriptional regulator [Clostridiales Family XIII bacterium]